MKSKKAETSLVEQVIFYSLNLFFIISLMIFINNTSSGSLVTEERYAKTIALAIDSMRPGTELTIPIADLYRLAETNKVSDKVIVIQGNKVVVKTSNSKGYEFQFVSSENLLKYELNKAKEGEEVLILRFGLE